MEKRYSLQKVVDRDNDTWQQLDVYSDDLETLKQICAMGYRIIDGKTGTVIYDPVEK